MVSGKYLPSQLRTQNAGPEPATRGAGAAAAAAAVIEAERIGEEIRLRGRLSCCCFWMPPKNMSNRPSAETLPGTSARDAASVPAATSIARRRMRE